MANDSGKCPDCGAPLFDGRAAGLCFACLGRIGLGEAAPTGDSQPPELKGQKFGDYELIEEVARGGMGVVYKARQLSLDRLVALKVVLHGPFASPEFLRRFNTEAAAAAALRHPNIVTVYEAGHHDGDRFLAMEYIAGKNFAELVREGPLPARRAARYVKLLAQAVEYAHSLGILHRDLKPSNVLLDPFDQPRITDFGLAKVLHKDTELTTTGQVLGSPGHMPPEQAAGRFSEVGPAGDIYSLGAVLYHLVTARPPFQGETVAEILRQVAEAEPVLPRRLNPSVPADLQTICLKCLEKNPANRYATAREVAEDLERFISNEPISARPINWPGRLLRWCRRKPALAASLGAGAALLLIVAIGSPIAAWRIDNERRVAENAQRIEQSARVRAETAEKQTEQQLFFALVDQARALVGSGELGQRVRALDALRRASAISNTLEVGREAMTALALPDLRFDRELHWGSEYSLRKFSPDFHSIALCRTGGPVEIRAVLDGRLLNTLPASTNCVVYDNSKWSPDGKYFAVKRDIEGGNVADWELWDVGMTRRTVLLHDVSLSAADFHPNVPQFIAGKTDGSIFVMDVETGKELARFHIPETPHRIGFSADGTRYAVDYWIDNQWKLEVHDSTNGALLSAHTFDGIPQMFVWHPSSKWLAVPCHSGAVYALDARSGDILLIGQHKSDAVLAVFTPDGEYLFTGGWDNELICWDAIGLRPALNLGLETYRFQLSGDGSRCAVLDRGAIRCFDFERPLKFRRLPEVKGVQFRYAAFSPGNQWLAASDANGMAVWALQNDAPAAVAKIGYEARPFFNPDGSELFGSRNTIQDKTPIRWRVLAGDGKGAPPLLEQLPLHEPDGFTCLSLHPKFAVITCKAGSQAVSPEQFEGGPSQWQPTVLGVNEISPNGLWLGIYAPFTSWMSLYRVPEMSRFAVLYLQANIADLMFSPACDELAVSTRLGIEFWSTSTWQRTRALTNLVRILYNPDGRTCWMSKQLRGAGLYDARTHQPMLLLPSDLSLVAVSGDGNYLAVSGKAGQLQVWDMLRVREEFRKAGVAWPESPANLEASRPGHL